MRRTLLLLFLTLVSAICWAQPYRAYAELPKEDQQPFGFAGYIKDPESGLYYAKARYYDPRVARFTTEDPAAGNDMQPPSLHRYLYAYANPTAYIDPDGRQTYSTQAANAYLATLIADPARRGEFERIGAQIVGRERLKAQADTDAVGEFVVHSIVSVAALARDVSLMAAEGYTGIRMGGSAAVAGRVKGAYEFATNHPLDKMRQATADTLVRADEYERSGDYYNAQKLRTNLALQYGTALAGAPAAARSMTSSLSRLSQSSVIVTEGAEELASYPLFPDSNPGVDDIPLGLNHGTLSPMAVAVTGADDPMVMVYRGTRTQLENEAFDETGLLLSESGRIAYAETGDVEAAVAQSAKTHEQWIRIWNGSETDLAKAHAAFGDEMTREFGLNGTLISVTTDRAVAEYYARGGRVYSGLVPQSQLIRQPLEGAGESEYLLRNGTDRMQVIDEGRQ